MPDTEPESESGRAESASSAARRPGGTHRARYHRAGTVSRVKMARFSVAANAVTDGTAARSKVVELTLLDGLKERGQGRPRVDQGRTGRVPGVPHRDGATRQFSHLHTAPAGVADAALAPLHAELISRDAASNLQLFLLGRRGNAYRRSCPADQAIACTGQPNRSNARAHERAVDVANGTCIRQDTCSEVASPGRRQDYPHSDERAPIAAGQHGGP